MVEYSESINVDLVVWIFRIFDPGVFMIIDPPPVVCT